MNSSVKYCGGGSGVVVGIGDNVWVAVAGWEVGKVRVAVAWGVGRGVAICPPAGDRQAVRVNSPKKKAFFMVCL